MPVEPLENGDRWSKFLQYAVATVYLLAPVAYWGISLYNGESVDMLIWLLVTALTIASAYLVFGTKRMDNAIDTARDLTGQDDSDDSDVSDESDDTAEHNGTRRTRQRNL